MREGFSGYPEWRRDPGARLTVSVDVETYSWPNYDRGVMQTDPSGRRRVVIEGEEALVDAILAAAHPAIYAAINEAGDS